jgi:hypothetical protein
MLVALIGFLGVSNSVSAQERTKLADGIYLVDYGRGTMVIENDNTQQSVRLEVTQKKDPNKVGAFVYDVMCGNEWVRGIAKTSLAWGIKSAITAYSGGTLTWLGVVAGGASTVAYDKVCNYFSE